MEPINDRFKLILEKCIELKASDIHLTSDCPISMRVRSDIKEVMAVTLTSAELEQLAAALMSEHQKSVFLDKSTVDFAFFSERGTRFRVNVFRQRGTVAMAIRRLDDEFRSFEALALPPQMAQLASFPHGLVIVTGPTGSGKSTTLATLINCINETRHAHIITIEDPLEFIHVNKKSLVRQRELYCDVPSFAEAVRASLREDPDVILVGEMRDLETMRAAIVAAETGHLVFSTLHTGDVVGSISRMTSVFPAEEQFAVKNQLARVLRAVVSQKLLHRVGGKGRVPAVEVMFVTPAISNLIRTGDIQQIYSMMQTGNADGMLLLEQSLANLCYTGLITREDAVQLARDTAIFDSRLRGLQQKAKGQKATQPA
jgi:twitching motility protein PilT